MKLKKSIYAAAVALTIVVVGIAVAGAVYDRETVTCTGGSAVWTNDWDYSALELKRIWIHNNLFAAGTVTVTRVTSDNVYTDTVGTVTCSSGDGSTASFTASYLKPDDMLRFSEANSSNCTAIVEFLVQQH